MSDPSPRSHHHIHSQTYSHQNTSTFSTIRLWCRMFKLIHLRRGTVIMLLLNLFSLNPWAALVLRRVSISLNVKWDILNSSLVGSGAEYYCSIYMRWTIPYSHRLRIVHTQNAYVETHMVSIQMEPPQKPFCRDVTTDHFGLPCHSKICIHMMIETEFWHHRISICAAQHPLSGVEED